MVKNIITDTEQLAAIHRRIMRLRETLGITAAALAKRVAWTHLLSTASRADAQKRNLFPKETSIKLQMLVMLTLNG